MRRRTSPSARGGGTSSGWASSTRLWGSSWARSFAPGNDIVVPGGAVGGQAPQRPHILVRHLIRCQWCARGVLHQFEVDQACAAVRPIRQTGGERGPARLGCLPPGRTSQDSAGSAVEIAGPSPAPSVGRAVPADRRTQRRTLAARTLVVPPGPGRPTGRAKRDDPRTPRDADPSAHWDCPGRRRRVVTGNATRPGRAVRRSRRLSSSGTRRRQTACRPPRRHGSPPAGEPPAIGCSRLPRCSEKAVARTRPRRSPRNPPAQVQAPGTGSRAAPWSAVTSASEAPTTSCEPALRIMQSLPGTRQAETCRTATRGSRTLCA